MTERVLIAGVGHPYLRDMSVGPVLVPRLRELPWPEHVEIEDVSYNPIAVVQWLEDRPGYFTRAILISAARREREPGSVHVYRWDGALPDPENIQVRVTEAVTGIISLDNLVVIGGYFRVWPSELVVVEVEARDEEWGSDFSEPVEAAMPALIKTIRTLATGPVDQLLLGSPPVEVVSRLLER
jgi:hydrogenase maturation protease